MKIIRRAVISLSLVFCLTTSVFGQTYIDVPEDHWAYKVVEKATEKKWMTGNLQNEFKPQEDIDYFYFSAIAAKIAGYKDPLENPNISQEEKKYADEAYQKYQSVLNQYNNNFKKWDEQYYKNYNEEIAYLLHKGVLRVEDLSKFIIKQGDGTEQVSSLTREDLAVFVVRLIGKEEYVINNYSKTNFLDDSVISSTAKPHVAYLNETGIFQGGENTKFDPKGKVFKAMLAKVLVESVLESESQQGSVDVDKEVYIQGKVEYFNSGYFGINSGNKTSYYPVKEDAKFYIGSKETNKESIKKDDTVLIQLIKEGNNDYISKITKIEGASTPTQDSFDEDKNTPATNANTSYLQENLNISPRKVEGVVKAVKDSGIEVIVKYVNHKGEISEEIESYIVSSNSVITKNNKELELADINKGDIIVSEVRGNLLTKGEIIESQREISGILVEKKRKNGSNVILLDYKNDTVEYSINSSVSIKKKGLEDATWNDLRIGDKITLDIEYEKVTEIWAEGYTSRVTGIIQEVVISANQSKITIEHEDGKIKTYPLIYGAKIVSKLTNENISLYDVRLGQEVTMYLDSMEVEELVVGYQRKLSTVQGYIENINFSKDYVDIRTESDFMGTKRIRMGMDVEVFRGNKRLSRRDLKEDMLVVITMKSYGSDQADTINILGY